ncbi:hypothetical protein [Paenibacillus protaetiae]|nr:hypothetical protein [Paenibacillus protaetiae]
MFFTPPMLPEPCSEPFDDERYWFEPKLNGRRLLLSFFEQKTTLYNRFEQDVTRQYPELCRVPLHVPADVVLDGEVVYWNADTGRTEPETVADRFRLTKDTRIRDAMKQFPVTYVVFDILYYDGVDTRQWPLCWRKALLWSILEPNGRFRHIPMQDTFGVQAHREAGLFSGIIAKRKDSLYVSGHNNGWQVIDHYKYEQVVISGFRKNQLGWRISQNGKWIGLIEHPIAQENWLQLHEAAQSRVAGEDRNYYYLEPGLEVCIRFRNWTRDGLPHRPEFVAFTG